MSVMKKLWNLFDKYDHMHAELIKEYVERERLIKQAVIDHSDESRPE
jgi:hypothetical protein